MDELADEFLDEVGILIVRVETGPVPEIRPVPALVVCEQRSVVFAQGGVGLDNGYEDDELLVLKEVVPVGGYVGKGGDVLAAVRLVPELLGDFLGALVVTNGLQDIVL